MFLFFKVSAGLFLGTFFSLYTLYRIHYCAVRIIEFNPRLDLEMGQGWAMPTQI